MWPPGAMQSQLQLVAQAYTQHAQQQAAAFAYGAGTIPPHHPYNGGVVAGPLQQQINEQLWRYIAAAQ
jgi:hypothetical protein